MWKHYFLLFEDVLRVLFHQVFNFFILFCNTLLTQQYHNKSLITSVPGFNLVVCSTKLLFWLLLRRNGLFGLLTGWEIGWLVVANWVGVTGLGNWLFNFCCCWSCWDCCSRCWWLNCCCCCWLNCCCCCCSSCCCWNCCWCCWNCCCAMFGDVVSWMAEFKATLSCWFWLLLLFCKNGFEPCPFPAFCWTNSGKEELTWELVRKALRGSCKTTASCCCSIKVLPWFVTKPGWMGNCFWGVLGLTSSFWLSGKTISLDGTESGECFRSL